MSPLLLLLALVGCSSKEVPVAPSPPVATIEPSAPGLTPLQHRALTADRMHALFGLAESARVRLIRGELSAATGAGAALSASPAPDGLPELWQPFVADMLAEADTLSHAESAEAAGASIGRLAVACGSCHVEAGAVQVVKRAVIPPDIADEDTRMWQHQWAVDWMWAGLLSGDTHAYRAGAAVFADASIPEPHPNLVEAGLQGALAQLIDTARLAAAAETDDARAQHYGHLIASCSGCHSAMGGGPPGR